MQCFALQQVLRSMGYEPYLIQLRPQYDFLPWYKYIYVLPLRLLSKIRGNYVELLGELNSYRLSSVARNFCKKNVSTKMYKSYSAIRPTDFDALVAGSDQIWRPEYLELRQDVRDMFLSFSKGWDVKRVAYAASFGLDDIDWPKGLLKDCGTLLQKFDAVSVREATGVNICRERLGREDAVHVLDPTLLLDAEDYILRLHLDKTPKSKGALHYYLLDETEDKHMVVGKLVQECGLVPFRVNSHAEDPNAPISQRIQPPVERWLRAFYDAEVVVTDSFHACVFSIIFRKPFIVYANSERGYTRFESLLGMLGLTDCLIHSSKELSDVPKIDYDAVYENLQVWRTKSMNFLKDSLSH